ncbi:hypothetical protein MTsPCn5_19450 [Croceitalea sp. MTPC5]|uniref:DUF6503 family protein n=1 Tax=Croceitalea sp. MTPC5 TaxID=3056565 RepID=UPI002B3E017C|nr:hypothetical protein MTsPCn5_19450 [Croceitalea sp. MTPC5]
MKTSLPCIVFLLLTSVANSQSISGSELLEKAIDFHDPNEKWSTFSSAFKVTMQTPNSSERLSIIRLDIPRQSFVLEVSKDDDSYAFIVEGDSCKVSLNGKTELTEDQKAKHRLNEERGFMYRDYYTYLYGLPMKLKDAGTLIDPIVKTKEFKGKKYLVLQVDYDARVGEDRWYFYFDPQTYAMKVYQFYHDESKNDGEYILLSGLEEIGGIKMPKTRAWYYNKDDNYLGTDILTPN